MSTERVKSFNLPVEVDMPVSLQANAGRVKLVQASIETGCATTST